MITVLLIQMRMKVFNLNNLINLSRWFNKSMMLKLFIRNSQWVKPMIRRLISIIIPMNMVIPNKESIKIHKCQQIWQLMLRIVGRHGGSKCNKQLII